MALADWLQRPPPQAVDEMGQPAGRVVPMNTGAPQVSGIQEYLAKLGLQPNAQNINRARVGDTSVAPRAPMNVLPQRGELWAADTGSWDQGGDTSAAPAKTVVPPPDPNASNPGAANSGLLASLAPAILGGAPLAAILGRQYLDSRGNPPGTAPVAEPASVPGADLLNTKGPGFAPEVARPPGSIMDSAGFKPEYGGSPAAEAIRAAVAPAEAAPRPLLQTAGVDLQPAPAPVRAPSGPGFDPEIPSSPTSAAIDKAVPTDAPAAPRAKAKSRARTRIKA